MNPLNENIKTILDFALGLSPDSVFNFVSWHREFLNYCPLRNNFPWISHFLHVLKIRHWLPFVLDCLFMHVFTAKSLEIYTQCLPPQQRACFLTDLGDGDNVSLEQRAEQPGLMPVIEISAFLSSVFHSCNAIHICRYPSRYFYVTSWNSGARRIKTNMMMLLLFSALWVIKSFVSDPGSRYLLPASLRLWQANFLVCK